jgi:co-chaperonin GroES (HSP10)|tara:strand:+ start:1534 stop:1965 length:432 start_codon:yes stop_codon:yes gene_type:complete
MTDPIPDRVLNFGSSEPRKDEEGGITPETLDAHVDKLPRPTGYRVLILPFKTKATTKGGIMLAKQTMDKEHLATVVGLVVALGPDAYKDPDKFSEGPWCSVGDWVIFGRYAGARFRIEGGDMRLLNDDEILAVIDSPEDILNG